jgi:hypothetical protein
MATLSVGINAPARKVNPAAALLVLPLMWMGHWITPGWRSVVENPPKRSSIEMGNLA